MKATMKKIVPEIALLALNFALPGNSQLRIAMPAELTFEELWSTTQGTESCETVDGKYTRFVKKCRYFRSLGYTHVIYKMPIYNEDFYKSGVFNGMKTDITKNTVLLFKNAKSAIESEGLQMIPLINVLSHLDCGGKDRSILSINPDIAEIKMYQSDISMIRTVQADASNTTNNDLYKFTTTSDCYVILAHDATIVDKPLWLETYFSKTGLSIYGEFWFEKRRYDLYIFNGKVNHWRPCWVCGNMRNSQNNPSDPAIYGIFLASINRTGVVEIDHEFVPRTGYTRVTVPNSSVDIPYCDYPSPKFTNGNFNSLKKDIFNTIGWVIYNNSDEFNTINLCYHVPYYRGNTVLQTITTNLLQVVQANWGTGAPQFIHFGGDELGYVNTCLVNADGRETATKARLVAEGIENTIQCLNTVFGPGQVTPLYFSDSYTSGFNGETYGLCGDLNNSGNGGILDELKDIRQGVESEIILCPWNYSQTDPTGVIDKLKQIKYMVYWGFPFITFGGEDFDAGINWLNDIDRYCKTKQCNFEWFAHSNKYPNFVKGHGFSTWPNECFHTYEYQSSDGTLTTNYTAPIVAFLADNPHMAAAVDANDAVYYDSSLFNGVNFRHSRNNMTWTKGSDYTLGLGIRPYGNAEEPGPNPGIPTLSWNTGFTELTVKGKCTGDLTGSNENFMYAFAQRSNAFIMEFELIENKLSNVNRVGIMVRNSLKSKAKCVHLNFSKSPKFIALDQRSTDNGNLSTIASNGNINGESYKLKITRSGSNVAAFYAVDNSGYMFLGNGTVDAGPVYVGLSICKTIGNGSATFTDLSLHPIDITPILNLLLD
ncbi:MAG: hypothetical protein JXA18_09305 [Chitinispirillaceae bacterium]|nr:hypothetical protein [Chitinispirillaceae bacterium]